MIAQCHVGALRLDDLEDPRTSAEGQAPHVEAEYDVGQIVLHRRRGGHGRNARGTNVMRPVVLLREQDDQGETLLAEAVLKPPHDLVSLAPFLAHALAPLQERRDAVDNDIDLRLFSGSLAWNQRMED